MVDPTTRSNLEMRWFLTGLQREPGREYSFLEKFYAQSGTWLRSMFRRLIRTRHFAKGDGQPIPAVDGHNCQSQVGQFLFRELLANQLKHVVGNMRVGDARDGFRPRQRGAFAVGKERS